MKTSVCCWANFLLTDKIIPARIPFWGDPPCFLKKIAHQYVRHQETNKQTNKQACKSFLVLWPGVHFLKAWRHFKPKKLQCLQNVYQKIQFLLTFKVSNLMSTKHEGLVFSLKLHVHCHLIGPGPKVSSVLLSKQAWIISQLLTKGEAKTVGCWSHPFLCAYGPKKLVLILG